MKRWRTKQSLLLAAPWLLLCAAGLAAPAPAGTPDGPSAAPAAPLPAKALPYAELTSQCAEYQRLTTLTAWSAVYEEGFSPTRRRTWKVVGEDGVPLAADAAPTPDGGPAPNPWNGPVGKGPVGNGLAGNGAANGLAGVNDPNPVEAPRFERFAQEGFREILLFDTRAPRRAFLAVGPKVRGDFAVEFVGKSAGVNVRDLTVVCDGFDRGPAFQFGGYDNTRNLLWAGPVTQPDGTTRGQAVDLPAGPLVRPGQWHRVRMEVREGQVSGWVDGHCLGRAALSADYDSSSPRQPMLCTFNAVLGIDEVKIERPAPDPRRLDAAGAWRQAFGATPRAVVGQQLADLVDLLGDDDEPVRDAAEALLARAGPLAVAPLREAAANGPAEQQGRAAKVLRLLGVSPAPVPKAAPAAAPPPAGEAVPAPAVVPPPAGEPPQPPRRLHD